MYELFISWKKVLSSGKRIVLYQSHLVTIKFAFKQISQLQFILYFLHFSGQRMLEEFETHLDEEETRQSEASERLEKSSQLLVRLKAGVEHLSDKLQHLKAVSPLPRVIVVQLSGALANFLVLHT
jgi:hypothetical protein